MRRIVHLSRIKIVSDPHSIRIPHSFILVLKVSEGFSIDLVTEVHAQDQDS